MSAHNKPNDPMLAKAGDTVKVNYTCKLEDGKVFATTWNKEPKEFVLGSAQVLPGLQDAILGMESGEWKTISIPPERAYGPYHDEMTAVLDRSMVGELDIEVGVAIRVKHSDGHESDAFVTEIDGDRIAVDGNHPLAGKTLLMEIELVEIGPERSER